MRTSYRLHLPSLRAFTLALLCTIGSENAIHAAQSIQDPSIKQKVQVRGVGKEVKVKETKGTTLRGKITTVGESSFSIQVGSRNVELPYSEVMTVEGPGWPKAAKISVLVVVVLVTLGIVSHYTV